VGTSSAEVAWQASEEAVAVDTAAAAAAAAAAAPTTVTTSAVLSERTVDVGNGGDMSDDDNDFGAGYGDAGSDEADVDAAVEAIITPARVMPVAAAAVAAIASPTVDDVSPQLLHMSSSSPLASPVTPPMAVASSLCSPSPSPVMTTPRTKSPRIGTPAQSSCRAARAVTPASTSKRLSLPALVPRTPRIPKPQSPPSAVGMAVDAAAALESTAEHVEEQALVEVGTLAATNGSEVVDIDPMIAYRTWEHNTGLDATGSFVTVESVRVRPSVAAVSGSRIAMSPVRRSHRTTDAEEATSAIVACSTADSTTEDADLAAPAPLYLADPTSPAAGKQLVKDTGLPYRPNPALAVRVASERQAGPRIVASSLGAVGIACTPRRRAETTYRSNLLVCGLPPMTPTPAKAVASTRKGATARRTSARKSVLQRSAVQEGREDDDEEYDGGDGEPVDDEVLQQLLFSDDE
jgi:hypothetical protein